MFRAKLGVKQRDLSDCGPSCLSSIAAFYGKRCAVQKIRLWASTSRNGTNIIGMLEASKLLGFEAKAGKASMDFLENQQLPAIAMVKRGAMNHFVAIFRINRKTLTIMDPALGRLVKIGHDHFTNEWVGIIIFLKPSLNFNKENQSTLPFNRILQLIEQYKPDLLRIFVYSLGYTSLGLATSLYIKVLVDQALVFKNGDMLNHLSAGMILITLFMWAFGWYKGLIGLRIGQLMDSQLHIGYYNHVLTLPSIFFDNMRTGEILSRIGDAFKIRGFIADSLSSILVNLLIVLFSFLLMFVFSIKLALVSASIIPIYLILYTIFNSLHRQVEYKVMEKWADVESHLISSIESVATIRENGIESQIKFKYETKFIDFLTRLYRSGYYSLISNNLSEAITRVFTIVILWIGASEVIMDRLTVGELLSFYALIGYFKSPLQSLMGVNKIYQSAIVATERLMELEGSIDVPTSGKLSLNGPQSITFSEVSFKYGASRPLMKEFNLKIDSGKFTVVIGQSGSGKSTLLYLIRKKYLPNHGIISIGNFPLNLWSEENLNQILGIAPQHPSLLPGSLLENICLGCEINTERVMEILSEYKLSEFFCSFQDGVNTYAGEGGVELSGGQKQVISILRIIYQNPDILLFDEPTSMMDPFTANFFIRVIKNFKQKNKTIVLVTHQLKISLLADHIVVMDKGKILEQGTADKLLERESWYSKSLKEQGFPNTKYSQNGRY